MEWKGHLKLVSVSAEKRTTHWETHFLLRGKKIKHDSTMTCGVTGHYSLFLLKWHGGHSSQEVQIPTTHITLWDTEFSASARWCNWSLVHGLAKTFPILQPMDIGRVLVCHRGDKCQRYWEVSEVSQLPWVGRWRRGRRYQTRNLTSNSCDTLDHSWTSCASRRVWQDLPRDELLGWDGW